MRWLWNRIESDRLTTSAGQPAAARPAEGRSRLRPAAAERSPVRRPVPSGGRAPSARRSPGGRSPLHRRTRRPRCHRPTCRRPRSRKHFHRRSFHRLSRTGSSRCCSGYGRRSRNASGNSGGGAAQKLHPCRRGTPSGRRSAPRRFASCQSLPGLEQMGSVNARRQALRHRGLRPQTRSAREQMPFHPAQNDNPSKPAQTHLTGKARKACGTGHSATFCGRKSDSEPSQTLDWNKSTHRPRPMQRALERNAARCSANVRRVRSDAGA